MNKYKFKECHIFWNYVVDAITIMPLYQCTINQGK